MLRTVPGKAACALEGLRKVWPGNHFVDHAAERVRDSERIEVLHYPLQTFEAFEQRVKHYGESLKANTSFPAVLLWPRRRWLSY